MKIQTASLALSLLPCSPRQRGRSGLIRVMVDACGYLALGTS